MSCCVCVRRVRGSGWRQDAACWRKVQFNARYRRRLSLLLRSTNIRQVPFSLSLVYYGINYDYGDGGKYNFIEGWTNANGKNTE